MAHLTGDHMQFWERFTTHHVLTDETTRGAWLYEQPLRWHLAGWITDRLWMAIPGRWHLPRGDDGFDWRLRFELWATYDLPHRGRVELHEVRLEGESWKPSSEPPTQTSPAPPVFHLSNLTGATLNVAITPVSTMTATTTAGDYLLTITAPSR